ncbi:RagB/SusD family nutrient uptake outer membrane protein [Pedobacter jejuensis]|uniref:RagB/SusD family nutrient uptake outer membrane protein n=1 Tax=Pedobacter jejuensis TaxID=1268550 RepID=A0A3N0BTX7_9SPHI|nr:RagB/SusD family nutrient uptake outer membrane protein [Pedobacter jejuensis]RNL52205.1 RagB/SusD family nutrient uptake outer membrane protein [Pedobacter jejuensis]
MKKIFIITAACLIVFGLSNCKKVLDQQDISTFTADQVFNDSTTAKLNIDYLYSQNQPGWFGNTGGSIHAAGTYNLTEEGQGSNNFVLGTVTIENVTDIGVANTTSNAYGKIRTINTFIRDINAGTLDAGVKRRFAAQAYFWRAYRYFELVKLYGGVPLVLVPLDAVGDQAKKDALVPRSKTSEVFAQIKKDLDSSVKYLPGKWPKKADYGRITSGAAAAFMGRVLLTYASPQFNPNNDATRWQSAYDANKTAVTLLSANGYGLYNKWDYTMWTLDGANEGGIPLNPESVFVTAYNTTSADAAANSNTYDNGARPRSVSGGGSFNPSYEMSLAFPMADGKPAAGTGASTKYPYALSSFYKNRDPRFYQTIAYNGATWGSVMGSSRLWTYFFFTNAAGTTNKSTEATASNTGFYLRKGVDESKASPSTFIGTNWPEIRYAEVLLNLAECAAELNKTGLADESYANLIALRKRAGLEAGSDGLYGLTAGLNRVDLVNAIMKERQIEFAFEGKRFWDLRRRKLLESTLNGTRRNALVVQLRNTATSTDYIALTREASAAASLDAFYTSNFIVSLKVLDNQNINFQAGNYFYGIPTAALNNNINLVQNNTWGGAFDPLQ